MSILISKVEVWGMKKHSIVATLTVLIVGISLLVGIQTVTAAGMMGNGNSMMNDNNSNSSMMTEHTVDLKEANAVEQQLNLPPILKPDRQTKTDVYYTVTAKQGQMNFKDGQATKTYGYNGSYLGPVIQINNGQTVHIKEVNDLPTKTTFHWHGAIISGKADGGPHDPLAAGKSRTIKFKVQQPAAMLWFHPHPSGQTGKQVYKGLAGLIYVNDANSKKLSIPKKYGVDDFPVVVQDRTFDKNNQFNYKKDYNADGTLGENLLINGTLNPYINVSTNFVRLRLLNGSNARNYNFKLSNNQVMYKIAGDGSFLDKPVKIKKLQLSPGERAQVIVDTTKLPDNSELKLVTGGMNVLTMKLGARSSNISKIPNKLDNMQKLKQPTKDVNKEKLVLSGMSKMVQINGKQFNPDRIDLHAKVGQQQIWTIQNKKEMMMNMIHPFHLHGVQFRILSINGKKPPLAQQGYLDTITLNPGDSYKISFKFEKKGLYMYHCHNLEHEENGMMGQILVQ
jgi:FtsP/CotA-like multicopper oxidase with cupredoxin domain